ncbi:V-set domain-containing T-cell activation inhibitor 1 [Boleophthalmus pectinirostris]|uniref:V-set domain-containing T-cell activation inhibitor 1 n=1 Tax=Boleophthalmus pectinirostris TaxID=150288 RepID=UPI00242CD86C|nr:V-set domain-containing T-cell activation inhibitor 1 [Boleophthalmus pectinirostris]
MASLKRIIGCSMVILIVVFSGIIIIILACTFTGRLSSVLSSDKSPVANLGENQLLSCYLRIVKIIPLSQMSVTWMKSGVSGMVYQFKNGAVDLENQSPQFKGRAALSLVDLRTGNASLFLSAVRNEDQGVYTCTMSSSAGAGAVTVDLHAGAFSAPSFTLSNSSLTAVAERWFPEPNVTWTNLSGTVLHGTTSLNSNSAGVYSVETVLSSINTSNSYILKIENSLKISVSKATVTGSEIIQQTYLYNTNKASSPLITSTSLTFMIAILYFGLAIFP